MEAAAEKSRSATFLDLQADGPIIIYTRLPAGGTYCPICTFPTNNERLSAFLMPFLPLLTGVRHLAHVLTVPPTKACLLCATPAGLDLYIQAMSVTLSLTINETLKWLSSLPILMQVILVVTV